MDLGPLRGRFRGDFVAATMATGGFDAPSPRLDRMGASDDQDRVLSAPVGTDPSALSAM